jgi:hypothetical protein
MDLVEPKPISVSGPTEIERHPSLNSQIHLEWIRRVTKTDLPSIVNPLVDIILAYSAPSSNKNVLSVTFFPMYLSF